MDSIRPDGGTTQGLRTLAADENRDALDDLAAILTELGHTVIARAVALGEAERIIDEEQPDLAIVKAHDDDEHALELIETIVREASCPVVALRQTPDADFAGEAAERGVYAYVSPMTAESVEGAIEVARLRFAEAERLEGALERRAVIERAKGMLMERHGIDEAEAFERLRETARPAQRKLVDVAREVTSGTPAGPRGS